VPRLDGRTIAVTRGEKPGGDPLAARLRELGAEVLELASIAIAPPRSWDELDRALRAVESFDWLVFASAHAVDRTVARAAALGIAAGRLARPRLAAVGPATAARLAEVLRPPDLVPGEARGEALAAALAGAAKGGRVLVPRAEDGRPELVDGLRAAAEVVAPPAYRTVAAAPEALAPLAAALANGKVDAVAFASPSAVRSVASGLGELAEKLRAVEIAAIGPTTAAALRALGFPPTVQPRQATGRDLAEAIAERLGPARPTR
jgi:uroporphyrinogen-III synthase/uroporphyrinogen III methyltransferase/synthase